MKELLEVIIKGLVDNKDNVSITEKVTNNVTSYQIKVDSSDMGQVIGKQGKMAKAIRTVMRAASSKEHKKINIEFI